MRKRSITHGFHPISTSTTQMRLAVREIPLAWTLKNFRSADLSRNISLNRCAIKSTSRNRLEDRVSLTRRSIVYVLSIYSQYTYVCVRILVAFDSTKIFLEINAYWNSSFLERNCVRLNIPWTFAQYLKMNWDKSLKFDLT
jgi:hypothetical protein